MSEKLQKVLGRSGYGSRRKIEAMINNGHISVDGIIAKLGDRIVVNPEIKIRIDGNLVSIKTNEEIMCRVLVYYKKEGEVCTLSDPEGRPTAFDRLPKLSAGRWISVGRLDINTSGLLLFTTDGELANCLMHPSNVVEREYAVRVFSPHDVKHIDKLKEGVQLKDGIAMFRTINFKGGKGLNQWYTVTLTEGRNREVRSLWAAIDMQVSRLIRIRYANIVLPKWLSRGSWIELDLKAINYLRSIVDLKQRKSPEKVTCPDIKSDHILRSVKEHTKIVGTTSINRNTKEKNYWIKQEVSLSFK